ncbi:hypothetical protein BDZ94DRAFT_1309191 [Collybia nuda]|uniref:Uncharacterized protein n=1 Tax=Collybia nuda TaxID=64659 RepID=A0A9P6CEP7_9AGAR|nr:hypothetical protein BDZ94DRAFT_1309191 [Collybia nuda]
MLLTGAALAFTLLAVPVLGGPATLSPRAQIACSLKVTGVLQLRMPDNPNISATGASFVGPQYTVNGVESQLLKIFAPNNADFEFHMCNSTFMGYTQRPSEFGTTFLYGQLKDKVSGLCVTGTHLGDFVTTSFSAQPCSVRDNTSQLRQFFRFLAAPPQGGSTTPDQNPQLMFLGVPQSDNESGADRYSFSFSSNNNAPGDSFPKVVAKNPRKENSFLGFFAPQYL